MSARREGQPRSETELAAVTVGELVPLGAKVQLVPSDPSWPGQYAAEAANLRAALGDVALAVHHVGSTSVPGLTAKPIIDVILVVEHSEDESAYVPALTAAGYALRIREPDWFEHRMLKRADPDVNLHVFPPGCPEVDRMLTFRNWLRNHDDERLLYEQAKQSLSRREWRYVQHYADAKTGVIEEILLRAMASTSGRVRTETA